MGEDIQETACVSAGWITSWDEVVMQVEGLESLECRSPLFSGLYWTGVFKSYDNQIG